MRKINMILIGGSAGSLDIVLKILPHFKSDLNIPVVIVLHRKSDSDSMLIDLLSSRTELIVKEAEEKEKILPNVIYVAPADYHLLIEQDQSFSLDASEKINYSRPSIDVTFEAAANIFEGNLAAMLLSGANADGVNGLKIIQQKGGVIVVQDPQSAIVSYMPQQAINALTIDLIISDDNLDTLVSNLHHLES